MKENRPMFLYSSLEKDKEALDEIINASISCNFYGPILIEDSPIIYFESMTFYGLSGAKSFIKQWKKREKKIRDTIQKRTEKVGIRKIQSIQYFHVSNL